MEANFTVSSSVLTAGTRVAGMAKTMAGSRRETSYYKTINIELSKPLNFHEAKSIVESSSNLAHF